MSWNQIILYGVELGAAIVFCLTISCLIEIRKEWWRRILLLFGCWLSIFMIMFTGDLYNLPPTLLFFLFCVWNACLGSGLKRMTIGVMFASIRFALNALYDNCISKYIAVTLFGWDLGYIAFRVLSVLILYLLIHHYRPEREFELAPSLWKLLLMLCIPPMGIVCSLVLFRSPFVSLRATLLDNTVLFLIAVVSFVGIWWAMLILNRQQKLEQENALAEYNKKYYEAMEQQQFEVRRMKHDLANHLQALLSLPAEEKDRYIQKMIGNPSLEKMLSYSGDATVNAVLTAKESLMRQRGISFHAKVDIAGELPFEKPDLCALFANALDNAVEACAALEAGKRQIELTVRAAKGILAVEVKNPFEGELSNGLPRTTKQDAQNHGYGLRSIQEIVKKYGGNMELRQENGQFCLFLFMHSPMQR